MVYTLNTCLFFYPTVGNIYNYVVIIVIVNYDYNYCLFSH